MAIFNYEKTSVLRHLEYGIQGLFQVAPAGGSLAYGNMGTRYFKGMGSLLYRLNQMAPDEEARVLGRPYGAIGFSGLGPHPGDTVTVTITGGGLLSPATETVIIPNPLPANYNYLAITGQLAQQFAQNVTFLNGGFFATNDYGSGPFSQSRVQLPVCSFVGPNGQGSFTVTIGFTGQTAPQIMSQGLLLPPYMQQKSAGLINTIYGYLPILDFLEAGWLGSQQQMSLNKAEEVTFRHDEAEQRQGLYDAWLCKFAKFLQIPVNPDSAARGPSGSVSL